MFTINLDVATEDQDGWVFDVEVDESDSASRHTVSLTRETFKRLARSSEEPADFLRRAVEFLLKRESKESILSSFDVEDITRYFPEFEEEIR